MFALLARTQTCVEKSRLHKQHKEQMYMHNPAVHVISVPFEEHVQIYVDHGHMLVAICLIEPALFVLALAFWGVRISILGCSRPHFWM